MNHKSNYHIIDIFTTFVKYTYKTTKNHDYKTI